MYDNAKSQALSTWHELLTNPDMQTDAQDQYDELLRLADNFWADGVISREERRALIEVATVAYTRAVEGARSGT